MRETVKIRAVAGSVVVSLPQSVLEPVGFREGDRVIVEAAPPRRLVITKEGKTMTSTQHLEMEIDLLGKRITAIESDLRYKEHQHNNQIPCEPGMDDQGTAFALLMGLVRDRDKLEVDLAEKRMELYSLQAGEVADDPEAPSGAPSHEGEDGTSPTRKKVERAWFYVASEGPHGQFLALANAKGSCSLRRFDAQDGTAIPKGSNRPGDYRDSFSVEIKGATPLSVEKQPSLERDCKSALPSHILQELQNQIQRARRKMT